MTARQPRWSTQVAHGATRPPLRTFPSQTYRIIFQMVQPRDLTRTALQFVTAVGLEGNRRRSYQCEQSASLSVARLPTLAKPNLQDPNKGHIENKLRRYHSITLIRRWCLDASAAITVEQREHALRHLRVNNKQTKTRNRSTRGGKLFGRSLKHPQYYCF